MGKVKCVRDFKCEVCGILGMLQILSNTYARVRHYIKIDPTLENLSLYIIDRT